MERGDARVEGVREGVDDLSELCELILADSRVLEMRSDLPDVAHAVQHGLLEEDEIEGGENPNSAAVIVPGV